MIAELRNRQIATARRVKDALAPIDRDVSGETLWTDQIHPLKITSTTLDNGRYPGQLYIRDDAGFTLDSDIRVRTPNGETLQLNRFYYGRLIDVLPGGMLVFDAICGCCGCGGTTPPPSGTVEAACGACTTILAVWNLNIAGVSGTHPTAPGCNDLALVNGSYSLPRPAPQNDPCAWEYPLTYKCGAQFAFPNFAVRVTLRHGNHGPNPAANDVAWWLAIGNAWQWQMFGNTVNSAQVVYYRAGTLEWGCTTPNVMTLFGQPLIGDWPATLTVGG